MSKEQVAIDPLKQALAEILTKATGGIEKGVEKATVAVEKGVDFLSGQLPEVIEQLLMWKMWESLSIAILSIIGLCLSTFVAYKIGLKVIQWGKKTESFEFDLAPLWIIAAAIPTALLVFGVYIPLVKKINLTWLQIWLAPKIYLIEYVSQFLK